MADTEATPAATPPITYTDHTHTPFPVAPTSTPTSATEEPQGTPPTPPALKRNSRLAQIKAVVAQHKAEDAAEAAKTQPAAEPSAESAKTAPAAPRDEPVPEVEAKKTEAGKAKAWADVMAREDKARRERESAKRERDEVARERQALAAERAAQQEAADLLAKDPVAYAAKYGGKDFGKRLVSYTLDEKARTADEQASKLAEIDRKLSQLTQAQQQRENERQVAEYLGQHREHWKTDKDAQILSQWYDEGETDRVVRTIAEQHAISTKEILTPSQLASNLTGELKHRLERLAKTPEGQAFLRQFLPADAGAPAPARPRPPADAPKTLSRDLNTQGAPPETGLRKNTDKDRARLIREVLAKRQA
jgi:hypothetical protein